MKEVLIALWLGILSLFGMTPEATMLGGGPGTINQLDQWKSTSTPSAITQNVYGKPILITGLNDGCVELVSGFATTTTGLPCGSGGGAGGATTTINGVQGPTFTFDSSNAAFTYSTTTGTVTLNLATTSLASQLSVSLASTTNWNGFYDTPSSRITAGDALTWSGNTLNFDGGNAPGGELGGTWASPSIDDGLAVTNWNLTTPTLTSFFGTPCTGNDFLQDISDTGAFTCVTAAGGSGGGLATTSPWTNGNLAYVTGAGTVGSVATTSLSGNSQVALSQPISVIGGSPSVLSIVADSIGDTQLAFNTGQDLTTASTPTFSTLTVSNQINVGTNIVRNGDSDTYIEFLNDSQRFYAGGVQFLRLAETASDNVSINPDTNDVDFFINWDSGTTLIADGASGAITFGTLTGTANNCLQVNSSGVLSGTGAPCGGSGSGGLATSSPWTNGDLAYVTGPSTVGSVATGTISAGTGLSVTAGRAAVGGALSIAADTGYSIPLTASTTDWNSAYLLSHAAVTLAGEDYLSLSTQQITANAIDPDNLSSSDFGSFTCNGTSCTVDNAAISNAMLANSTVSYGGVSLSLGGTDATPAFNLADATGLPISTGVSGLGSNVATFLATPSSANLRSALTDEVGTGPAVFASSTMLTSPTLVSFFGTPCTGNEFLQDISDTGAFTCVEATGGGGGGSLSTSTDIIGAPGTVEDLSYVSEDFLIGGNSSTTAEFQFDPDGGQFFIASTTNGNATATVESTNNAQAVRLGDDIGSGIEWIFSTVGDAILETYGAVTRLVFAIAETLFQGNVRVTGTLHVATTTYYGATTTDAVVADGYINTGESIYVECSTPLGETVQIAADTIRACGRFSYLEDAAGVIDFVQPGTATSSYFRIRPGAAGTSVAAGDGMAIGWASNGFLGSNLYQHRPAMEWTSRNDYAGNAANASSTFITMGFAMGTVGLNMAAENLVGYYVFASSTSANFYLACNPLIGTTTYVDTGIATSTSATAGANSFTHWRLELSGTSATTTALLKARTRSDQNMTQVATCSDSGVTSGTVGPIVGLGKSTAGTAMELHTHFIKLWYRNFIF